MKSFRITRRVATGFAMLLWGLAVGWALVASLPHNPLSPGLAAERGTRLVLPEGWGFFTRNPREPDLILAHLERDGQWRPEPPHASLTNLLGLQRISRALPVESSQILHDIDATFRSCEDQSWQQCADEASVVELDSPVPHPSLCGDVAFLRREPVPWAWADLLSPQDMPTEVLRTRIRCNHGNQS